MNIFEKSEEENKSLIDSIHEVLTDRLNIDIDKDDLSEFINDMGLADYIELDNALDNKNIDYIKELLGKENVVEYSIQGRKNLQSTAASRPTTNKSKPSNSDSSSSSSSSSSTDTTQSSSNNTGDSDRGSLSPQEYKKQKELSKSIENEIDELEKMKKLAGIS